MQSITEQETSVQKIICACTKCQRLLSLYMKMFCNHLSFGVLKHILNLAVFPQGALTKRIKVGLQVSKFMPSKSGPSKKIVVNNIPKKKRFALIW